MLCVFIEERIAEEEEEMVHGWGYTLSGLLVGFLVGMTGVGGGSLMTPLLILLCGVKPQAAVGTDLLYAALTKLVGTVFNRHIGTVAWPVVFWLMAGSVPGAFLGLLVLHYIGMTDANARVIHEVLGVSLLLTAPAIVFRPRLHAWATCIDISSKVKVSVLTMLLGLVLGIMVALSSVGAGAIGMAALAMLYPAVSLQVLVATDIAHAVPLALVAGVGHWIEGAVDVSILFYLLVGSIPGILLGLLCVGRVNEAVQRWFLGVVLMLIGIKML